MDNLLIIDPNRSNNQINGPVDGTISPENLAINVQLKTIKKQRSTIVASGNDVSITGSLAESVDFMEGYKFDANKSEKSLSTHFTEIGSGFSEITNNNVAPDLDTLGITDIKIDFNASCAPIVVMNLVDIRGRLFQFGNKSPFAVFFDMPYPIFQLSVKGYYGKGVTYNLHLVKFNARFNSENGCFEIQCEFIGYTYAYLSDLLIGYLKGVPYTSYGKAITNEIPDFISFESLNTTALETKNLVSKIKGEDELKGITEGQRKVSALEDFKSTIPENIRGKIEQINFDEKNIGNNLVNGNLFCIIYGESIRIKDSLNALVTDLNVLIRDNNTNSGDNRYALNELDFDKLFGGDLKKTITDNIITYENLELTKFNDIDKIKTTLNQLGGVISPDVIFGVLDLTSLFNNINDLINVINEVVRTESKNLAKNLGSKLDTLSVKPSIGNYFKVLCGHADLLTTAIQNVAETVEKDSNSRKESFASILSNIGNEDDSELEKIRPFPDYKVLNTTTNGLEERWIGTVAPSIPEVLFVEELINGVLNSAREEKNISDLLLSNENSGGKIPIDWYPSHIFDTPLFNKVKENPYEILRTGNIDDFARLFMFRAFMFINSNQNGDGLNSNEIENMAIIEANNVLQVLDPIFKETLVNNSTKIQDVLFKALPKSDFKGNGSNNVKKINFNGFATFTPSDNFYNYTYGKYGYEQPKSNIVGENTPFNPAPIDLTLVSKGNILPGKVNNLNNLDLQNLIGFDIDNARRVKLRDNDGEIFIGTANPDANFFTIDDGTTYLKIISEIDSSYFLPSYGDLVLEDKRVGFDIDNMVATNFYDNDLGVTTFFNDINNVSSTWHFYSKLKTENGVSIFKNKDGFRSSKFDIVNNKFKVLDAKFMVKNASSYLKNLQMTTYGPQQKNYNFGPEYDKRRLIESPFTSIMNSNRYVSDLKFIDNEDNLVSLFGSTLYRNQSDDRAKAYLLLACIPYNGVFNSGNNDIKSRFGIFKGEVGRFFNKKSGIFKAPYAWILYVGAILSRMDNEFIKFRDSTNETMVLSLSDDIPAKDQLMYRNADTFNLNILNFNNNADISGDEYFGVGNIIERMPKQVRNEFQREFENWVDLDFQKLKSELEIFKLNVNGPINNLFNRLTSATTTKDKEYTLTSSDLSILNDKFVNNYLNFGVGATNDTNIHEFNLELNPNGNASKLLTSFLREFKFIANSTTEIWREDGIEEDKPITDNFIKAKKNIMDQYIIKFTSAFNKIKVHGKSIDKGKTDELKQEIFQTLNGEDIRLKVYKDVKSIYDKWISGSDVKNFKLYDTFKFINRSYRDIQDEFRINLPKMVSDLMSNYNQPLFTHISTVLTANNFNFMPLPNYVDLKDYKEADKVFETIPWNDFVSTPTPSFICMYTGEFSNSLDLKTQNVKNDAAFVKTDSNNKVYYVKGADFTSNPNTTIPIFLVRYGDQNQTIFKNIDLNQSEFTATNESLVITDGLVKGQGIGQNLFDIYQNRSYSINIDLMGNVMVQPFMYIMLENIPMFYGLYLIVKVSHNVTANKMTTSLKATRIKEVMTKMVDDETLFNSFFNDLSDILTNDKDLAKLGSATDLAPYVTEELPKTAPGLQVQSNSVDRFAVREVRDFILELAGKWNADSLGKPYNDTLYYNDLSRKGGGTNFNHSSHRKGLSFDVRQIATRLKNGNNNTDTLTLENFNVEGTRKFLDMAIELAKSPKWALSSDQSFIRKIYFNYKPFISDPSFNGLITYEDGHYNHIHFEFNEPNRITNELEQNNLDTSGNLSNSKGLVGPFKPNFGNDPHAIKINGVGKIVTPNLTSKQKALLDVIAYQEGTSGISKNGYDVALGYRLIDGWTEDTKIVHGLDDWRLPGTKSSAAGRYQFVGTTWQTRTKNSPMTFDKQNEIGLELLNFRIKRINSNLEINNINSYSYFKKIITSQEIGNEWASLKGLPDSKINSLYNDVYLRALNLYNLA